jgi:hypothetical protein
MFFYQATILLFLNVSPSITAEYKILFNTLAQSFSPNTAQDGRQTCRPPANFSVTKMQKENSPIF